MTDLSADDNRYTVPGLERGLQLLQLFDRSHASRTAPELARALALPRSTVFRLTQTLERLGFIERGEGNGFRLGPAVLRLGFEYIASLEITDIARPVVERLRDECGFPAQLVIRDQRDVVVVLKAASTSAFTSNVNVGARLPAHATILGRALMCEMSERELRELYPESRLEVFSAQTPRTLAEFVRLLREDRARGYVVSDAFFEAGVSAIVAPVHGGAGRIVAALGVALQQSRIEPKPLRDRLVRHVVAAAQALSHRLNYRAAEAA